MGGSKPFYFGMIHFEPRAPQVPLLELNFGSEGLKTAKITVNRRYLSWHGLYLANFETVLRTSSRFFEVFT